MAALARWNLDWALRDPYDRMLAAQAMLDRLTLVAALPASAQMGFYRTTVGAELGLVIEHRGKKVGIEIKFSVAPKPARGFWQSLKVLPVSTAWVIAPVPRRHLWAPGVEVIPLHELGGVMAALEG